jgi:hypothetical protein
MASDAFIVGEEWISEHYFNTDVAKQSFQARVSQRRKAWDAETELGQKSARDYFATIRADLVRSFAQLQDGDMTGDARGHISSLLKEQLGFGWGLYRLEQDGPVAQVTQRDLDEPARVVIVDAIAVEEVEQLLEKAADTLARPYLPPEDENHPITSVSRLLSRLFAADDGPAFALVLAGRWILLTDRQRWPEGRYLAINLQLAVDRNDQKKGGELDRTLACIAAESLLPDAEGTVWWNTVFEESIKHTVGVSKDLREGVRSSIEIIANEVVHRRTAQGLDPLPPNEAQPLAKQALRYLYRILFLLFAEASPELKVVPVGALTESIGRTSSSSRTRSRASPNRCFMRRAASSSDSPAGSANSPPPITPPRCSPGSSSARLSKSCSIRTATRRRRTRSSASPCASQPSDPAHLRSRLFVGSPTSI